MVFRPLTWRHTVIALMAAWCAATAAVFALQPGDPELLTRLSGLSLTAVAVGAGIACVVRARRVPTPRIQTAWRLLGAGALAWGMGQVVTLSYEVLLGEEV